MTLRLSQERKSNTLTVIIPALNAAATLPATLACLAGADIVVVDGGSTDGTSALAAAHGAHVITASRGRGGQLAAGIAATQSPWLLLLHADTRLGPGWRAAVASLMASGPAVGYFRFVLDSAAPAARRLERAVAWRCRVLQLPYGDQGLVLPRALLDSAGGMRSLPLMEDVDLVHRLRRHLVPLGCDAVTSAARWEREGWVRRSLRNLTCLALWHAGVPPAFLVRLYR